ncbi:MAG: SRPBCC family protein [Flavobacteriaceae bacterium]
MKIFKYLLFLLLIVIIAGAVYFGTKDGHFDVAASKTMQAPVSLVFQQANDYKNWPEWGPWKESDPNMQVQFNEQTTGEGASYSWTSEEEGDGSMKTLAVAQNDSILQQITFKTPLGDSQSEVYWKFDAKDPSTTEVTWGMRGEQSFMEKVFMAFQSDPFDTMLKTMFEKGLSNMDERVQEAMNAYTITLDGVKDYGGGYYLYTTAASKIDQLGEKMGPMLGKVYGFAQQNHITMAGAPFTLYNQWDEVNGTTIFSAALPVSEKIVITEGDVLCGYMPPLTAVKATLKGKYDHLQETYQKVQDYIHENNRIIDPANPPFEVYANDPGEVPNPAEWMTEVYMPVFKDLRSNHPIINENSN